LTVPLESLITPLYYEIQSFGLLNTRWALILPLIGLYMPFGVFWMRAYFESLPRELTEAAAIDGAGPWATFRRIHLPLATPALSSLGILLFLWTWNQFILAIALVDDPNKRTAAGALGAFQGHYGTDVVLLSAGSLLIMLPTVTIFIVFQRQFVTALLQGSVKG
jgi:raffinose/stachyose/melibiose transport system permease protein